MSKSLAAAEKAALDGAGQEWDTQMCIDAQEDILSQERQYAMTSFASSTNLSTSLTPPPAPPLDESEFAESQETGFQFEFSSHANADPNLLGDYESDEPTSNPNPRKSIENANPVPATVHFKRDAAGRLRPYTDTGEQSLPLDFEQRYQQTRQAVMEDMTQKSSLSLTQENSESVYEQFNHGRTREDYPLTATPDDDPLPTQANVDSLHSRYASARTESTAITYQEDDPRHIRVDFNMEPPRELDEEDELDGVEESQDASYAAPQAEMVNHSYDPQTPAPPINPFVTKGSVMKGHELFGATQPSSVGRCLETPASGRPSPNIYNDYSSPPKRRRVMSSPLNFAGVEAETSPLQSSVRIMLAHSMSMESPLALVPRTSGVQSFDAGPREPAYEPRAYVSMKESQERRSKRDATPEDSDSDSDGFDSDIPAIPKRQKIETALRKELSSVELRKKATSSRPSSAPTPAVEVPSTRRSAQDEEHIAQCEGHEARDTHQTEHTQSQDDIIVDSQAFPTLAQVSSSPPGEQSPSRQDFGSPMQSQLEDINAATPSLPPQEVSSKRQELCSPLAQKLLDQDVDTVPETSPPNEQTTPASPSSPASPEERLRPMREIASFSFGGVDDEDFLDDIAGLTQDVGFDKARRMGGSSPVPPRIRSSRKETPAEPLLPTIITLLENGSPKGQVSTPVQKERQTQSVEEVQQVSENDGQELPRIQATTNIPADANASVTSSLSDLSSRDPTPPQSTFFLAIEQKASYVTSGYTVNSVHQPNAPTIERDVQLEEVAKEAPSVDNGEEAADGFADFDAMDETVSAVDDIELPAHKKPASITKNPPPKSSGTSKKKASAAKAPVVTPRQSSRMTKKPSKSSLSRITDPSTSTTPRSSPLRNEVTPDTIDSTTASSKRTSKRKSGVVLAREESVVPTRSSKRQSTARESSEDPLALATPGTALFAKMAFAIGYVDPEKDRDRITRLITENSGTVLQDGFDQLFETSKGEDDTELRLSASSKQLGFTALIADEHSRKAKYIQALALGLPCISGHWISTCVSKGRIVEWAPYLLCAGVSSVLHAAKSRMLSPYSAATAKLEDVITSRDQLLCGKSVLFVTGKSKTETDKRKAFTFLTRVLGPARLTRVGDLHEAKKVLKEPGADEQWDMLYVDVNEQQAEKSVFGPAPNRGTKRKRVSDGADATSSPPPKKIRVIADETMVQSLIMGQLLEE